MPNMQQIEIRQHSPADMTPALLSLQPLAPKPFWRLLAATLLCCVSTQICYLKYINQCPLEQDPAAIHSSCPRKQKNREVARLAAHLETITQLKSHTGKTVLPQRKEKMPVFW